MRLLRFLLLSPLAASAWADAPAPQGAPVEMIVGATRELVLPGATGAEVADAKVASVEVSAGGTVKVKALAAGKTALVFQVGKERRSFTLSVAGKVQRVELRAGEQKTLLAPDTARVQALDSSVAEAHVVGDNQIVLDGRGRGSTQLLAWGNAGQKTAYEIVVGGEEPGADTILVEIGGVAVLNVKSLSRIQVADSSVASASTLGPDIIQIQGIAEGTTTVNAWDARGKVFAYKISVSP